MKPDTMRAIDYYAGVPLCAVVSLVLKAVWALMPVRRGAPRNILFIELSEMGSTVLAEPAMKKARRAYDAELFFVIFEANRGGLALSNTVAGENIFTLRGDSLLGLALDTLKFLFWCRRKRIDTVIDLELFSRVTALMTGMSGATRRIGFHGFHNEGLYRGDMLTHRVSYNPHMHIAKNFIALIDALDRPVGETPLTKSRILDEDVVIETVEAPAETQAAIIERIARLHPRFDADRHRLVLINANASDMLPQRRWPADRYAALIGMILEAHGDVMVLITGAASEHAGAEALAASVGSDRCINFAGQVELEELTALYGLATVMVSNDSGPVHFAALAGLPVVGLYGPETPKLYGPLGPGAAIHAGLACSPCVSAANHRKTACTDNQCLKAISVNHVFEVTCGWL